jgi:hypothetical protein
MYEYKTLSHISLLLMLQISRAEGSLKSDRTNPIDLVTLPAGEFVTHREST